MPERSCSVPECVRPPRSGTAQLCAMHYHRWYRHGDVTRTRATSGIRTRNGTQYRTVQAPGHPLAMRNGKAYEHRKVLFDAIGPGVHPCHWCHLLVAWERPRGATDALQPDHLNGQRDDNRPENLVPSCVSCNVARGQQTYSEALRAAGWFSGHDTVAALRAPGRKKHLSLPAEFETVG